MRRALPVAPLPPAAGAVFAVQSLAPGPGRGQAVMASETAKALSRTLART